MSKYFSWCCCFKSDSDPPQKVPAAEEGSEMQMMNARVNPATTVTQGSPEEQLLPRGTSLAQQTLHEEQEHEEEVQKPKESGSDGQERVNSSEVKPKPE